MTASLWITLISAVLGSGALTAVVTAALTAHRERKKQQRRYQLPKPALHLPNGRH